MPRYIVLADGDNELPVDLDNVLMPRDARARGAAAGRRVVDRDGPGARPAVRPGPEGRFTPRGGRAVRPREPRRSRAAHSPPAAATSASARFPPGSEWLYVKLYTGTATADRCCARRRAPSSACASRRRRRPVVLHPLRRPRLPPAAALPRRSRTGCCARRCPRCTARRHRCSRTASCGTSSSTPTSARSSATAARPGSSWPSASSSADSDAVLAIVAPAHRRRRRGAAVAGGACAALTCCSTTSG